MIDIRSLAELRCEVEGCERLAVFFYSEKHHEKSSVMMKVFEKLSENMKECEKWAKCSIEEISESLQFLKIQQIPTVWFCHNGAVLRIVNLPQAQLYVQEAKNCFQNSTPASPTITREELVELLDQAEKAGGEGGGGGSAAGRGSPQLSELDGRCHEIVNKAPLMIVMKGTREKPYCKFSKQLLALFAEHEITDWDFFDIFSDDDVRERLKELHDWPTYPQIYMNGKLVGGLDTVKEILKEKGKAGLTPEKPAGGE